jgi:hypothetical protein
VIFFTATNRILIHPPRGSACARPHIRHCRGTNGLGCQRIEDHEISSDSDETWLSTESCVNGEARTIDVLVLMVTQRNTTGSSRRQPTCHRFTLTMSLPANGEVLPGNQSLVEDFHMDLPAAKQPIPPPESSSLKITQHTHSRTQPSLTLARHNHERQPPLLGCLAPPCQTNVAI